MPELNRRSFLKTTGLVAPIILTSRKSSAAPAVINTGAFYTAGTLHCTTTAKHFKGMDSHLDWQNIAVATQSLYNYWIAARLDTILRPQYQTIDVSHLTMSYVDWGGILNHIKGYNPAVTNAQVYDPLANCISSIPLEVKTNIVNYIKANGIAGYILNAMKVSSNVAFRLGESPQVYPGPPKPMPYELAGGGEPSGCTYSGWGLFGTTLALLTLTIMTDGLDLLALAGWASVIYWGGQAATGWTVLHGMYCGVQ